MTQREPNDATYAAVVGRVDRGQVAAFVIDGQPYTITPARDPDGRHVSFRDTTAVTKPMLVACNLARWATQELDAEHLVVSPLDRPDTLPLDENAVAGDAQPADPRGGERAFMRVLGDVRRRIGALAADPPTGDPL